MIWAVTLLLLSAAMALPTLWPRLFPSHYVSDLYRRYEHNPHIHTTEIHNFHVNDTLSVDALLLQADTDSAWCALLLDFGTPQEMIDDYNSNKEFNEGEDASTIILFYRDKNDLKKRIPNNHPGSRLVIASYNRRTLCIFMTEDNKQKDIIGLTQIKDLKNGH